MTVQARIDASYVYLGNGTYKALIPTITEYGASIGWRYFYPLGIQLNGKRYTDLGLTLDDLEERGIVQLATAKCTCI